MNSLKSGLILALAAALLTSTAMPIQAQTNTTKPYRPAFDPRSWRDAVADTRTQVATLGSAHLSELPAGLQAVHLEPLLAKLVGFAPNVITHEGLSGEECDLLERHPNVYPDMFKNYCNELTAAAKATGLDFAGARAEVESTLKAWPAEPSPAQRRRLVAVFLASGDRPSAVVQWLQLAIPERVAKDGVVAGFLPLLNRATGKFNETYDIAAVLAARLGHQRVYAVDNHTADSIQANAGAGFEPAMQRHWKSATNPNDPVMKAYERALKNLKSGEDMLAFFRLLNQPETQRTFIEADYLKSLKDKSSERYGRQYVAWWETRNLRMVANIRSAFGNQPGAKVLNIVGASHKPYYEAYLDMISEVQLVDVLAVLR